MAATAPVAQPDRRFHAFLVDRLIGWGAFALAAVAAWWWLLREDEVLLGIVVIVAVVLVVSLAFAVGLGLRGTSPGRALAGIRVVDVDTGGPIGAGRALLRSFIVGVGSLPMFGLGLAALAWTAIEDRSGQRRGWHDHVARSVVLDVRPRPAVEETDDAAPVHLVNLTAMRLAPVRAQASRSAGPPSSGASQVPARAVPQPQPPAPPAAQAPAPQAPAPQRPAPNQPLLPTSPPPAAQPAAPNLPAAPQPSAAQPAAPQPPAPQPPAPQPPAPQPPQREQRPAWGPPLTPAPQPAQPPTRPPASQPADGATLARSAPGRRIAASGWRLTFDTGDTVMVAGLTLVGRSPEGRPGEPVRHAVALPSQDMSLSKTHAQFHLAGDGALVVTDRGSTNGSILIRQGVSRDLTAGRPFTLLPGDRVLFGDRAATVGQESQ